MKLLITVFIYLILPLNGFCEDLRVACAASFILPMKEISKNFEKEKNIRIVASFGSTGMLYNQIKSRDSYDIFFAADTVNPERLVNTGTGKDFFLYASGRAVLWTKAENLKNLENVEAVLQNSKSISIALPQAAPYGKTASDYLKEKDLLSKYKDKFFLGKNVFQSFQYAFTGLTDSGFCALSQALSEKGKTGSYFLLDKSRPIVHGGCILEAKKAAYEFVEYVKKSDDILKKYGYEKP